MRINVTGEHIANGKRRDECACPIALALRDAMDGRPYEVLEDCVQLLVEDDWSEDFGPSYPSVPLSLRAREFIRKFDAYKHVQPFAFNLDIARFA